MRELIIHFREELHDQGNCRVPLDVTKSFYLMNDLFGLVLVILAAINKIV